jgi:hypothetical protein
MRIRRTFPIVLVVVVIAAAVTLAVQLRKHAPPEPARLLPGGDAFLYVNLAAGRRANLFKDLPSVSHVPEYEQFIRETGFQFERDLDEVALAMHYPSSSPSGGTGGSAPDIRSSEVLVGKFEGERLTAYLRKIARSVETYHSVEIFTILIEGRSLRVAALSADSIAASNHDDPAVIHGMIDRSKRLASPFGGPSLLRQYYKNVQLASLAWAVVRMDPAAPDASSVSAIFSAPATVVISASALNPLHLRSDAVHVRAEAFTQSPDQARDVTDKVNVFVALSHAAESSVGTHGTDPDVKAFFDSVQVKQDGDRAILSATLPPGFVRKALGESSSEPTPSGSATVPAAK